MPEEVKKMQTAQKPRPSAAKAVDKWLERTDPKSGRKYYYNPKLKQTSWTKPQENDVVGGGNDAGKGHWVARHDPRTNRQYFYNQVTKMTSWTNPDEESKKPPSKPGLAARMSKRISFSPSKRGTDISDAGSSVLDTGSNDEAAPAAPTNLTTGRASIRLGAIAGPAAGSRLSMAGKARAKRESALVAKGIVEEARDPEADVKTPSLEDRFAKLRALRNRAQPEKEEVSAVPEKQIDLEDLTAGAVAEVTYDLRFETYVEQYMNLKKLKKSSEQAIAWQKDKLKTALHHFESKNLVHDALIAHQNIMCYMGDKPTKDSTANARKIFAITVSCPEEMRDEVFCQLVKQTNNNPDTTSTERGWELMAICAGLFPPSSKLEKYLLSYVRRGTMSTLSPKVTKMAEYVMLRLQKSIELGPRKEIPTDMEIAVVREIGPLTVRVHMLDGQVIPLEAEAWTTVGDFNTAMAKRLKIQDPTPFSTFEIDNEDVERGLEDDDRVLDIIAYWQREAQLSRKKKKNARSFQFVYKVRLFFDIKEEDENAVEVAFHQAVHDVTDSRYPCSESDCLRLAALQAQEKFGDCTDEDVFANELQAFLPAKYYDADVEDELKSAIMETYRLLRGYDRQEAMNNYLDYVKAWKIYGSAYFWVSPHNNKDWPENVILAINAKGILVVDPATKDFLAEYPYSELVTWGHSNVTLVLVVGNLIRQNKLYFKSDDGIEINSLVHAYVNHLVEE